nr:MAG TPA: hypothetical protein [Caudoviricetes sp.]
MLMWLNREKYCVICAHNSDRNGSKSCYFVLCKGDEYEKLAVKFILNL